MSNEPLKKLPGNAHGRFFTTSCCILCDACFHIAPELFKPIYEKKLLLYYTVVKQPETEIEMQLMQEAYAITFEGNGPGPCIIDIEDLDNLPESLVLDT